MIRIYLNDNVKTSLNGKNIPSPDAISKDTGIRTEGFRTAMKDHKVSCGISVITDDRQSITSSSLHI